MQDVVAYESPAMITMVEEELTLHPWVVWVVAGLTWASALWFAWYCRSTGGYPSISVGWTGFRVACNR